MIQVGNQILVRDGVPLRGAHTSERAGVLARIVREEEWRNQISMGIPSQPTTIAALDPDGSIAGPFYAGEWTLV